MDGRTKTEALEASNDVYKELLDETTAQITIIDADSYRILYANRAALEKTKNMPGSYVGSVCYEFISGCNTPCPHCMIKTAEKGEYKSRMVDFASRSYKQLYKIVEWNGCRAMMEYTEDVTEQLQNITYARQEKELMSLVLNNIPVGIVVYKYCEGQLSILDINTTMRDFLGISDRDVSKSVYEAILNYTYDEDKGSVEAACKKLKIPGVREYFEFRIGTDPADSRRWMAAHAQSVAAADGAVNIYIGYTDITEQKKAMKVQLELDSAKRANNAIMEFYSRMSHDLRTPMNGILGLAELSMEEKDSDVLRSNMKKIHESGKYLLSLINDTLDFQKIQSGKMRLEPKPVKTVEVFGDIYNMIKSAAVKKGVDFRVVNENADMEQYIVADGVRLKQIFVNLLSNAVKFTPSGGTVELCVKLLSREGMLSHDLITITDTGIGMSREFLDNGIFKPFQQDRSHPYTGAGTGLGLSIVKKLVEMMGGTIAVESEPGTGTRFMLYLDFQRVNAVEIENEIKKESDRQDVAVELLRNKKILLAEDHPLNAEISMKLLEKVGCRVDWARNGAECVRLYEISDEYFYDAVIMDIRMPVMDGLEAARTIRSMERADSAKIPIIAVTANAYEEDVKEVLEAGMNGHLAKPVEPQQMYEVLVAVLAAE